MCSACNTLVEISKRRASGKTGRTQKRYLLQFSGDGGNTAIERLVCLTFDVIVLVAVVYYTTSIKLLFFL